MIKNVLPSLRQRAGPQRICSRQKSIRSGTARDSFSQPPHMRGKVDLRIATGQRNGITPAYAGKSRSPRLHHKAVWDHPRVCGEKRRSAERQRRLSDHPRMCGEKAWVGESKSNETGSPPHVRGKGSRESIANGDGGITPACAGKSVQTLLYTDVQKGSPPHVRGKGCLPALAFGHVGITPACAGKRRPDNGQKNKSGDHPRMCGEKYCCTLIACRSWGSPPHVRGKGGVSIFQAFIQRITPACAGKSTPVPRVGSFFGDHPRMCGEKTFETSAGSPQAGSPPHVRGKV